MQETHRIKKENEFLISPPYPENFSLSLNDSNWNHINL